MLRALVALLVLANLLFFGWVRGWLAPTFEPPRHAEREPGRLAAQVRPEAVVVLPAKVANAAVTAARAAALVCLQAGPFGEADVAAAEAALAAASLPAGSWTRDRVDSARWLVFAGRFAESAARTAREQELRLLGLAFEPLAAPAELAPGLVLSRHATREQAEAALATVAATPLKGARVVELPATTAAYWLRVPRADSALADRLTALPAEGLGGGFSPCATARDGG